MSKGREVRGQFASTPQIRLVMPIFKVTIWCSCFPFCYVNRCVRQGANGKGERRKTVGEAERGLCLFHRSRRSLGCEPTSGTSAAMDAPSFGSCRISVGFWGVAGICTLCQSNCTQAAVTLLSQCHLLPRDQLLEK